MDGEAFGVEHIFACEPVRVLSEAFFLCGVRMLSAMHAANVERTLWRLKLRASSAACGHW